MNSIKNYGSLIMFLWVFLSAAAAAGDACRTPSPKQCGFYRSCVETKYNCGGQGYPIAYGEKYCERFLSLTYKDLSLKGIQWRDATLVCLQNQISNLLYSSNNVRTCGDLKAFAFDTHAGCYTQKGNSICDLSYDEMTTIGNTVDVGDVMTINGVSQIFSVLKTCYSPWKKELVLLRSKQAALKSNVMVFSMNHYGDERNVKELEKIEIQIHQLEKKMELINEVP
ncbi:hypothetical protein [Bdellovibrio reynosensis]|uniref:Uncharacterized protein n=1 Tax=Bdellovibrio reynosensis TaxID=2835041 RepID=A0ABY4CA85_9BACT|nr:hypothetical protein [Bdellovibrio reynosensis]UOF00418.1 hypothetical protein MNR06_11990 [Bdellovibrio reynosensis]